MEQTDLTAVSVARGSIYLTLQNAFSTLIAAVGFAFMARMITREEMGAIAGLVLLTSIFQLISDFGLSSSIPKHVSELKGKGEDISTIIVSAIVFRILICIVLSSTLFFFASNFSLFLFKTTGYASAIRLLSLDAIVLSPVALLNNVMLGAGKLRNMAVFNTASIITRWIFITVLLLTNNGTVGIILGWIAGDLALLLMQTYTVIRLTDFRKEPLRAFTKQALQLLRFALPLYLASAVSFLYTSYDRALILFYLPLSDVGIYNTTYMAFSVLITLGTTFGSALLPYYGVAYGRNQHEAISLSVKRTGRYTALIIFPLTLGLLAASRPTLALFAGPQYETGWVVLAILSLFGLVYGIAPPLSNILLVYGKTKTILILSFVPVISSLSLLPLVRISGLLGLAVVRGTSISLSFILTTYLASKTVRVQIDRTAISRALAASAIMAGALLILQQVLYGVYLLPLYVLSGALVYIASIRALNVLVPEDFQLLRQILGKRAAGYAGKILGAPRG